METKRLLLVDDVALFLQLERTFLTRSTFFIDTATSGEEALKSARGGKPDLIVLDLHMPDMDGDTVCRLLKGDPETSSIPIIMLSSGQKEEDAKRCLDAGCQAYLTKPINKEDLCRTVEEQLKVAVRAHTRVDVIWPCQINMGEHEGVGFIRNLSEGGAFLTFEGTIHNGRTVRLQFQIPGNPGPSMISAKVCWVGRVDPDGPEGFGISYQVVSTADLAAMRDYISEARRGRYRSSEECVATSTEVGATPEGSL